MSTNSSIRVFDSQSAEYHEAFQVFLAHTDQKANARRWLDSLVQNLTARRVFIDAGAGNGQVTQWLLDQFERTIAIEPSPSLNADLRKTCPRAELMPIPILDARPPLAGDLVLCSHVLYYIERDSWLAHLDQMASWLAPKGLLVVVLQNHETDCMRMLERFHGRSFNLSALMTAFETEHGNRFRVERELVPAHVTAPDVATACTIAEFMLNLLPLPNPPARETVENYVRDQFADGRGGFRFSCHQDFLVIRPRH